jgi:hypothetical protein
VSVFCLSGARLLGCAALHAAPTLAYAHVVDIMWCSDCAVCFSFRVSCCSALLALSLGAGSASAAVLRCVVLCAAQFCVHVLWCTFAMDLRQSSRRPHATPTRVVVSG